MTTATAQAIVDNGLYWWHRAVLQELVRIEGFGPVSSALLADNMQYVNGSFAMDTRRNIHELAGAGLIEGDTDELRITASGREWVAA